MSEKFDWKTTQNTSRLQLIQGLDTNIHCLAVELDLLPFIKPFKVILTKRFVLIKLNRNLKHEYDDKQFKYKLCRLLI